MEFDLNFNVAKKVIHLQNYRNTEYAYAILHELKDLHRLPCSYGEIQQEIN